ncbi:DUF2306 domain-containing protein [Caulobacter mirabilis]|uniref:DUF2306 domain-containing protein n=1 Tax=Caulobacter mirabilis TaxID=69666 RepID=A0A2D2B256_9CAUL|nr:DUF2306 domain-containing protein [Caulobacter mirabilis]ATQ44330.1 hypothetical protein CSW64_19020 [Caulobacter mirabilis]
MPIVLSRSAQALAALLAVAVGLFSFRYLLPEIPLAAPDVVANRFAHLALPIHAGLGAAALILGPFQFIRRRDGRRARWHRLTGALYMAACLGSAPAGLILALGATAGPIATAGFGLLAIIWFWVNAQGLRAALAGRYAEHGRWMVRSFALTFAAVTLRLYLPLGALLPVASVDAYRAIAFLAWVPNLLVAELWLSSRLRAAAGR